MHSLINWHFNLIYKLVNVQGTPTTRLSSVSCMSCMSCIFRNCPVLPNLSCIWRICPVLSCIFRKLENIKTDSSKNFMRTTSLFYSLYIFIENCIIKSLHLLIFIDPIENPKGRLDLLLLVCLLVCPLANFL